MKPNLWTKGAIFVTFLLCCVVLALLSSSLATDYWVTATGHDNGTTSTADVNLGLFRGRTVKTKLQANIAYDVKLVCLTNGTDSVCMFSCGPSAEQRTADLADLIYNDGQTWSQGQCTPVSSSRSRRSPPTADQDGRTAMAMAFLLTVRRDLTLEEEDVLTGVTDVPQKEPQFMSYGLWLSTIVMLGAAIAFTLVAAMFAILNTATTPVETIFGVVGLYVWNAIAMVFELLALSLWGAQFHQHLQHSVLWREEQTQQWTTDGMASLGYSYWLVFVAMFLHAINMGVLWFGTHQMRPKTVQVPIERDTNTANMIY